MGWGAEDPICRKVLTARSTPLRFVSQARTRRNAVILPARILPSLSLKRVRKADLACLVSAVLLPSISPHLLPFGLALALTPLCLARRHNAPRLGPRDLAAVALFGSAAAFVLWPSQAARLGQLVAELCQRGPEWWRSARIQSPPEIVSTLQGCVQPDRISHLPAPIRSSLRTRDCDAVAKALARIIALARLRTRLLAVQPGDPSRRPARLVEVAVPPWRFILGRSPPARWTSVPVPA